MAQPWKAQLTCQLVLGKLGRTPRTMQAQSPLPGTVPHEEECVDLGTKVWKLEWSRVSCLGNITAKPSS